MKLTLQQVEQVKELQLKLILDQPKLRKGQAFFIALHKLFPDVASDIAGSINDPFYVDSRIYSCINEITE